jgi:hypothetical protein
VAFLASPEAKLIRLHTFETTQVQTALELRINCAPKRSDSECSGRRASRSGPMSRQAFVQADGRVKFSKVQVIGSRGDPGAQAVRRGLWRGLPSDMSPVDLAAAEGGRR